MARPIQSQNVTIDEIRQPILSKGVAKNRRISSDFNHCVRFLLRIFIVAATSTDLKWEQNLA
ncbi:hypothetical protein DP117_13820 [Brasilonema sp. UFV-L1]|nr:hypothetical protein [Brasilonema sp. UFV-L1]